ncbi:MAG: hypothetical protein CM15mP42_01520 [Methanobacteriota archaeon]|nr:MAG: hypothetical protein CM15mP42_01520 [Euryarchaeota archaeon]
MDRIVVGITGASGIPYGIRLLEILKEFDVEIHLTCSDSASLVNKHEGDGRSWKEYFPSRCSYDSKKFWEQVYLQALSKLKQWQ